ncbi:MAG: hypothetical protein EOP48_00745 [Sphingobacteriales bacterium]|nr:MAG: hypothetical protein EOP48_00745 [Sphingobacteriales bacterium]
MAKLILAFLFLFILVDVAKAQTSTADVPMIGAEVFIEPGQTPQEIDTWFRRMKEAGMTLTRIRMFERYMHSADGKWDFTLFDEAYKAGENYGIKIYGNLFPATPFTDVGGFKFPRDEQHLKSVAEYIKNLVTHFKQFKSCYGWVPINEPGSGGIPKDAFTKAKFEEWKKIQPVATYSSKGYEHFDFAEERFLLDYNTWFLKWLADEIHKYDPGSPVHVNNHQIFQLSGEYNFPEWRNFLTSLGGSAHASWHFGYFNRDQYAMAMSANSEMLRSGAGNIPWLMTEMQGGNNTYSGYNAMCPTKEEIAQWLWTTIGTGSKGAIFWCLNPRASGVEAGEWAMLDFQNKPSDRMNAAGAIATIINKNTQLFANAKVVESGINILYIREAMWVEKKLQTGGTHYEGRDIGGVIKSALGYFEALSEMGVQSNLKEIDEFDFTTNDYSGTTIILAHQIAIPSRYWQKLQAYVSKGGKLIVDGMTGYYDENALCVMKTGFPLEQLFGGNVSEFKMAGNLFNFIVANPSLTLPAHLWSGTIVPTTGKTMATTNKEVKAIRNTVGKGEVVWVPSLLGLGGRVKADYSKLASLLNVEAKRSIAGSPFRFKAIQPKMLMKTLKSGDSFLTIVINKSAQRRKVTLENNTRLRPSVMFADHQGVIAANVIDISPEESIVIEWK